MKMKRHLVTHTFKGRRFDDHGLDIDAVPELHAFKELLVATARELWRTEHPERQRLPKNFQDAISLKFYGVEPGSAAVPICREVETEDQTELWQHNQLDELDEAVLLVTEAIHAAGLGQPLPERLPKNVIPLFETYGRTLRDDESFELKPAHSQGTADYTRKTRATLLGFRADDYEDRIDLTGEVWAVDLRGKFVLRLDHGARIEARFTPEQETTLTEALRDHVSRRLRVRGKGDFRGDGELRGIVTVADLTIQPAGELPLDEAVRPVWELIEEIGQSVPSEEWESVPTDGARNLDHYLYGHARR